MQKNILIVDDDTISVTLISHILNRKGYRTIKAMSAGEAIDYLDAGEQTCLILCDVIMPDMNGIEFFSYIRRRPSLRNIPVIMCSADRNFETINKALLMGVKDYIVKPIDSDILLQKIRGVLMTSMKHLVDSETVMTRLKIDHHSYQELLNTLMNSAHSAIKEMEDLVNTGNFDRLKFVAAALSGGAKNLGAERLSGIIDTLVEAVPGKDARKTRIAIESIKEELTEINDARKCNATLSDINCQITSDLTALRKTINNRKP